MKRKEKNLVIWLMFGLYLGTFIPRAIKDISATETLDWILIVAGIITAMIHYSPDRTDKNLNKK